jgi:hypothetical protein
MRGKTFIGSHDTEEYFRTDTGQYIYRVHEYSDECESGCVIHNPSYHTMRSFPTHYREDRQLMERICPHGVGHPDPDSMAWLAKNFGLRKAEVELVHGCDGCCHGAYARLDAIRTA